MMLVVLESIMFHSEHRPEGLLMEVIT